MIIELNKHYINAKGDVIFIHKNIKGLFYPFRDVRDYRYDTNGKHIDSNTNHVYDLICECNTYILNKYMDKEITQKEFIQQHMDYYTKALR